MSVRLPRSAWGVSEEVDSRPGHRLHAPCFQRRYCLHNIYNSPHESMKEAEGFYSEKLVSGLPTPELVLVPLRNHSLPISPTGEPREDCRLSGDVKVVLLAINI